MKSKEGSLSPAQFEAVAGDNLKAWQLLLNCQVVHNLFGQGLVIDVEYRKGILFSVRFEQPYEMICERQFTAKGFGKFFTQLTLPDDKFERVRPYIGGRTTPKSSQPVRPKSEIKSEARITQHLGRKSLIRVKPGIYRSPNGTKPKLRKLPSDPNVKCPYCIFTDCFPELAAHMRTVHLKEYPAWAEGEKRTHKSTPKGTERKKADSEEPLDPEIGRCPICECLLKRVNYPKHLKKVHPGKTETENPLASTYSRRKIQTRKRKKITRTLEPSWRSPSGKRAPILMKVLNVGRKGKHYTRRW